MTDPGESLFGPEDRETFEAAVATWGFEAQVDMAVEECLELALALEHWKRGRADLSDVVDELADVRIMYEQLSIEIDEPRVRSHTLVKMDRLRERVAEAQDDD